MVSILFSLSLFTVAQASGGNYTICKLGKEARSLRVETDAKSAKCKATYTKNGKDQSIGESSVEASCVSFAKHVQDHLETANWKCREIKDAGVSQLPDETATP